MFVTNDLEISKVELKKLVNFLPFPIIISEVVGGQHLNFFLNKKFLTKIGYTLNEVPTSENLSALLYPDESYRNEIIAQWAKKKSLMQETGKDSIKIKALLTCKSGEKKWFEIKGSIVNNLHIVAFVDINSDIMLQEKLKKINFNNDRMLSILGHDLRSPIANLIAVSSMAEQSEISQKEFISLMQIIKGESLEVLELLDTTMSWARLNFNSIQQKPVAIDFNDLLINVLRICKASYNHKKITINVNVEKLIDIKNDAEILTIIIRNLISNAIKFTPENGSVDIYTRKNILVIEDNGIGMTQTMIDQINNNNYFSRRGTNNEKGVGIGLQLAMNLAKKINCTLLIKSEVTKGTTVQIIFDHTDQ